MKRRLAIFCLLAGRAAAQDVTLVYPEDPAAIARSSSIIRSFRGNTVVSSDGPTTRVRIAPAVTGNYILRDGDTITASGMVELRTPTFVLTADSAVINTETREIKASGNVRITLTPPTQK